MLEISLDGVSDLSSIDNQNVYNFVSNWKCDELNGHFSVNISKDKDHKYGIDLSTAFVKYVYIYVQEDGFTEIRDYQEIDYTDLLKIFLEKYSKNDLFKCLIESQILFLDCQIDDMNIEIHEKQTKREELRQLIAG